MSKARDIAGQRYGRLIALRRNGSIDGRAAWLCKCDCGQEKTVKGIAMRTGNTVSCGCKRKEDMFVGRSVWQVLSRQHGLSGTTEYHTWLGILRRCLKTDDKAYPDYGGRGITVCEHWQNSFENFLSDMGHKPSPEHTIDRIDNDRGYEPDNCRWATSDIQMSNTRANKFVEHEGRRLTYAQLARLAGVSPSTVTRRAQAGRLDGDGIRQLLGGRE